MLATLPADPATTPFVGSRDVEPGFSYTSCLYVESSLFTPRLPVPLPAPPPG